MGLFGTYNYSNKRKEKFWLHSKERGKRKLYFFTKDPADAIPDIPKGFEVFESAKSGLPMIRRKKSSFNLLSSGKDLLGKAKNEQKT